MVIQNTYTVSMHNPLGIYIQLLASNTLRVYSIRQSTVNLPNVK